MGLCFCPDEIHFCQPDDNNIISSLAQIIIFVCICKSTIICDRISFPDITCLISAQKTFIRCYFPSSIKRFRKIILGNPVTVNFCKIDFEYRFSTGIGSKNISIIIEQGITTVHNYIICFFISQVIISLIQSHSCHESDCRIFRSSCFIGS